MLSVGGEIGGPGDPAGGLVRLREVVRRVTALRAALFFAAFLPFDDPAGFAVLRGAEVRLEIFCFRAVI